MGPSRAIAAIAIAAACSGVACSLLTHAYDYQVGSEADSGPPFPDTCGACFDRPDFARATCVGEAGALSTSAPTRDYSVDSVLLGTHGTTDDAYSVGINQDCADRPDGGPARCTPTSPVIEPFTTLPHGIENAFATQLLAPMERSFPDAGDVEARVSAWMKSGAGLIVRVDGWDGQTDGTVSVRIVPTTRPGTVVQQTSTSAQIVGGTLSAVFAPNTKLDIVLGDTNGALLDVLVFGAKVSGSITDGAITNLLITGHLQTGGQLGSSFQQSFEDLVLGCSDGGASVNARSTALITGAYDLPDPSAACSKTACGPCVDMSFGLFGHATRLAAAPPPIVTTTSCPGPEAGAPPADGGDASTGDASMSDATTD